MQCVSQEAAYPVSSSTLTHLGSVAQQLMRTDTQLYDKSEDKIIYTDTRDGLVPMLPTIICTDTKRWPRSYAPPLHAIIA